MEEIIMSNNLAVQGQIEDVNFYLPLFSNREEIMSSIADNMSIFEDYVPFEQVKIPTGGGLQFTTTDDSLTEVYVDNITGVIIAHQSVNAFWAEDFNGENQPPDCSSNDAITGSGNINLDIPQGQLCKTCPLNQWGTDKRGGKGKECKNIVRLYILEQGSVFPKVVSLPPTSITPWKEYAFRLAARGKSISGVVTTVKLEKAKSQTGILYSKAVFVKVSDLAREQYLAVKGLGESLLPYIQRVQVSSGDYNIGQKEFIDVGGGNGTPDTEPF